MTGIPNTVAAVRLARHGRGAAVVSEALNSSSVNVIAGLCIPAVVHGASHAGTSAWLALAWLGAATVAALLLGSFGGGLRVKGGAVLLGLDACFVLAIVFV